MSFEQKLFELEQKLEEKIDGKLDKTVFWTMVVLLVGLFSAVIGGGLGYVSSQVSENRERTFILVDGMGELKGLVQGIITSIDELKKKE